MFVFLVILIALIAVLLTLLVLLQSGKGGGLAGIAAGGATTQILGARQAPDFLEKGTWVLATLFIVLCILTNFAIDDGEEAESVIQQRARQGQTEQVLPPLEGQPPPVEGQPPPVEGQQTPVVPPPAGEEPQPEDGN